VNLREQARGEGCQVRVPLVCNHDRATTVCAHVRLIGISGMSLKAPDWFTAFACDACHDYVDGRTHKDVPYETRRLLLLEGMARTQAIRMQQGFLPEAEVNT
jgi:hypothetical protein